MTNPASPVVAANGRDAIHEEARETLAMLHGCNQTINVVLVALSDGVELEDGSLRRRSRFLRDTQARKYSDRRAARLSHRGCCKGALRHGSAQAEVS